MTSSSARSQSWLTAFTRAIALSGCETLLDLQERRVGDDVRARQQQALADDDGRAGTVRRRSRLPRAVEVGVLRRRKDADYLGVRHDLQRTVAPPCAAKCTCLRHHLTLAECSHFKPSHLNVWPLPCRRSRWRKRAS